MTAGDAYGAGGGGPGPGVRDRLRAIGRRRVVRDGAWVVAGQAASAVALLAGTRVTTQLVRDPGVLGTVTLLLGIVALARGLFFAPVLQAQFRFYSDYAGRGQVGLLRRTVARVLRAELVTLVAITLAAGAVAARWADESWVTYALLAGLLVVDVMRSLELNFLQAARRQKPVAVMGAAESLARPGAMALLVLCLGPSPAVVLGGYLIGSAAVYAASLAALHREGLDPDPIAGGNDARARELWRYALPLVPVAIVGWVTQISDRYLLGLFLGTAPVGIYAVTYALMSQPFLIAHGAASRTLMPIYFKAVSDGNREVELRTFRSWLWATVAVGVAGFVAILVLRRLIAYLLLAPQYRTGIALMPWIAAGYCLYGIGTVFEARLYARKLTRRVLAGNTITAVASLGVPLAFLPRWGVVGVAAACPVYFGIMVATMAWLSHDAGRRRHAGAA